MYSVSNPSILLELSFKESKVNLCQRCLYKRHHGQYLDGLIHKIQYRSTDAIASTLPAGVYSEHHESLLQQQQPQ